MNLGQRIRSTLVLALPVTALGCGMVLASTGALGRLADAAVGPVPAAESADAFTRMLLTGAGWLLLLGAAWLCLLIATLALESLTGGGLRWTPARCPARLRRCVVLACGFAVVSATLPAYADPGPGGLPLPHLPVRPHTSQIHPAPGHLAADRATAAVSTAPVVVVRPGDSLWRLAEATLPASADIAIVADATHALYQANRALIGADPDLITPGMRLRLPDRSIPATAANHEESR